MVTGTRAEYGLLWHLIDGLTHTSGVELQLVVTGMHLSPEFGHTVDQITADGFEITDQVEMLLSADTPSAIGKSTGLATIGFADCFRRLHPDLLVLLGDRFEVFAAAQAALFRRLPIAHLHGGEATEGLIDEAIRHAITKLSHLHFVATEKYRNRVIQMGEQPDRVFNVGALGIENIKKLKLLDRVELEVALNFRFEKPTFLVTYHPVTLIDDNPAQSMRRLLTTIAAINAAHIIVTYPNADTYGREIINEINAFSGKMGDRVLATKSLGRLKYLSTLQYIDVVIGNSSSGLIEVPEFRIPTINIGQRQQGRECPRSVIHCGETVADIEKAIAQALDPQFRSSLNEMKNIFGDGQSSEQIIGIIRETDLEGLIVKKFRDLP